VGRGRSKNKDNAVLTESKEVFLKLMRGAKALAGWMLSVGLAKGRQRTATNVAGDRTKLVAVQDPKRRRELG